jgi:hypothetical protein
MKGSTSMTIFDRVNITAAVGAGLCGVAMALSPVAAAGGYDCYSTSAGGVAAPAPCAAPLTDMSGVPMALPGPVPVAPPVVPVVPPLAPPVPIAPPVPVVPPAAPVPIAAPVVPAAAPVGAPLMEMAGTTGKGDPTGPAPVGAPADGQPIPPGPAG